MDGRIRPSRGEAAVKLQAEIWHKRSRYHASIPFAQGPHGGRMRPPLHDWLPKSLPFLSFAIRLASRTI